MARLIFSGILQYFSFAVPGQITITGVAGAGSVGTVVPSISVTQSGVVGTGAAGTAVAQVGALGVGVTATGSVGILTPQLGPIGVAGVGAVGSPTPSAAFTLAGAAASGAVGALIAQNSTAIIGVSCTATASDVFPIPPPPIHRPALLIPSQNGLPATNWLGS